MVESMSRYNSFDFDNELYTFEYFLHVDVCRLCWKRNADQEIINPSQISSEFTNSLVDKIKECLEIDVSEIKHPNKACSNCCDKIEKFHNFKKYCLENDIKLREILRRGPNEDFDKIEVKIETNEDFRNIDYSKTDTDFLVDIDQEEDYEQPVAKMKNMRERRTSNIKMKKKYKHKRSPTYCNICCLNLESKEKLSQHNAELHGVENGGSIFKCFGCEKRFKSRKNRIGHELNFCKGLKDGYKCSICCRYLPKRGTYESHMRSHRQNTLLELPDDLFKCKKCLKLFSTKECLKRHVSDQCMEKKDFICDTCGRIFNRRDYLHKHLLMHSGTKQHKCPHCDFKATQKSTLTVHIRRHTGERPYSCDLCPLRCTSSSNLRAHRRRHLGVKMFECQICNKKFGYKISLEEHMAATHERSEAHTCEECGATYSQFRGLRRHLAAKHGKKGTKKPEGELPTSLTEQNIDGAKIEILKDVRNYELKEGDNVLLIKGQDVDVYMV